MAHSLTKLQKRVLAIIDARGPVTFEEIETELQINKRLRGGFRSGVNRLIRREVLIIDKGKLQRHPSFGNTVPLPFDPPQGT